LWLIRKSAVRSDDTDIYGDLRRSRDQVQRVLLAFLGVVSLRASGTERTEKLHDLDVLEFKSATDEDEAGSSVLCFWFQGFKLQLVNHFHPFSANAQKIQQPNQPTSTGTFHLYYITYSHHT
jgi:hypothetical protein